MDCADLAVQERNSADQINTASNNKLRSVRSLPEVREGGRWGRHLHRSCALHLKAWKWCLKTISGRAYDFRSL